MKITLLTPDNIIIIKNKLILTWPLIIISIINKNSIWTIFTYSILPDIINIDTYTEITNIYKLMKLLLYT